MANMPSRSCPNCGTPVAGNQRFCSNCGTIMDGDPNKPTALAPTQENLTASAGTRPSDAPLAPPPPPAGTYSGSAQPPFTSYPPQGMSQPQQSFQQPPVYAQPVKDSSRGVLGQIGCGMGLIILLVLVICGVSGYFGWQWVSGLAKNASTSSTTTTTGSSQTANGITPTAVPLSTATINQTVTYASVDFTVVNVQQGSPANFSDDSNANAPILLRVNIKEQNTTTHNISYFYSDITRLILSDQSSVAPATSKEGYGPDASVTRTNCIDYPLNSTVDLGKVTLQLGKSSEAQMNIPLSGKGDLSKYQPKTVSPNTTVPYDGLKWTLTSATASLSAGGKQADSGMRFITVSLKADNPTTSTFYPDPNGHMRLKSGDITNPPVDSTLPVSIDAGTTSTTGTVTFQMPVGSTNFTLIFVGYPDQNPPISQATTDFQIS